MPSIGQIKKLSVVGIAAAALGLSASAASAQSNEVWLWACHGPNGSGLNDAFGDPSFAAYGDGCAAQAGSLDAGGMRGTLTPEAGGSIANNASVSTSLSVPPDTKLRQATVLRRTTGVVPGVTYEATVNGSVGETATGADLGAENVSFNDVSPTGNGINLSLRCGTAGGCAAQGPASLDVGRVGMKVTDDIAPTFAVGNSRSPAAGILRLDVRGNDSGVGLWKAEAFINGAGVNGALFGPAGCRELTDGDGTVDLPLDAGCPNVGSVELPVNTTGFPDGPGYELTVVVTDWAGNTASYSQTIEILNNLNLGTNVQTLNIGTSGVQTPAAQNRNNANSGVAGAQAQSCSSPRLSFSLSQKPMRVSKGTPVLQKNKRYRFTGRLTCVIRGKRVSAPKRTRVDIFNKVGKKTTEKAGTTVADKGRLSIILSYPSSRTLTFRFTNSDGKRAQVSIKIKVEKKKAARR